MDSNSRSPDSLIKELMDFFKIGRNFNDVLCPDPSVDIGDKEFDQLISWILELGGKSLLNFIGVFEF